MTTYIIVKGEQLFTQRFFIGITSLFLFEACSLSPPPPIMTDEKFDSRVNPKGITEFAYGISWKNTSQESLGEIPEYERKSKYEQKYQRPENQHRYLQQANKQTKLELEDKAAAGLKKRLAKEKLCPKGYDISNVTWKADNIRLLGFCH